MLDTSDMTTENDKSLFSAEEEQQMKKTASVALKRAAGSPLIGAGLAVALISLAGTATPAVNQSETAN